MGDTASKGFAVASRAQAIARRASSSMDDIASECYRWSARRSSRTHFRALRRDALGAYCDTLDGAALPSLDALLSSVKTALGGDRSFVMIENSEGWEGSLPEIVAGLTNSQEAMSFKGNASRALREHAGDETRRVYFSTKLDHRITLPQHCEAAYHNVYPKFVAFYCRESETPPENERQGSTPVTTLREVFSRLPPQAREHFEQHGVSYRRYLPSPQNKVALTVRELVVEAGLASFIPISTWADVFQCDTREELEVALAEQGIHDVEFLEDESILYTVRKDIESDPVWLSPLNLLRFVGEDEQEARQLLERLSRAVKELRKTSVRAEEVDAFVDFMVKYNCTIGWPFYGDGSPIPERHFAPIRDAIDAATVRFPWTRGSMLVLDNTRAMHGREHLDPACARKIIVSMA